MDEEKQLENTQSPTNDIVEGSESMAGETTAAQGSANSPQEDASGSPDLEVYAQAYAETEGSADEPTGQEDVASGGVDPAFVQSLLQENESLKSQQEELRSVYARLAADFDNFRKRTQKEKEDLEVQIKCSTLKELLPVVDNFERARSQIKPQTDSEMNIHKSYQSVYKQMVDCLKRTGVAPMRPEGQEFDPNLHEAVMREATDQFPEGTVMEELMRGYILGERVLRHAMVKVAAAPEPGAQSEETAQEGLTES